MTESNESYLHEAERAAAEETARLLVDSEQSKQLNSMLHDFGGGKRPDTNQITISSIGEMAIGKTDSKQSKWPRLARKIEAISFGDEDSSGGKLDDGLIDNFEHRREMAPNNSAELYSSK